jgi:hypothetical protein
VQDEGEDESALSELDEGECADAGGSEAGENSVEVSEVEGGVEESEDEEEESEDEDVDEDEDASGGIAERLKKRKDKKGAKASAASNKNKKPKSSAKEIGVPHAEVLDMLSSWVGDDPVLESLDVRKPGVLTGLDGGIGGFMRIGVFSGLTCDSVFADQGMWTMTDDPLNCCYIRPFSLNEENLREALGELCPNDLTVVSSVVVCTLERRDEPQDWHWMFPLDWTIRYKLKCAIENFSEKPYEMEVGDKRLVMQTGEAFYGSALTLLRGSHLKHFGRATVLFSELELSPGELKKLKKKMKYLVKPKFKDLPNSWPSYPIFDQAHRDPTPSVAAVSDGWLSYA